MAADMREALEASIRDGAVAMVMIYEKPGGRVMSRTVPGLDTVRLGLLCRASAGEG